MPYKDPFTRNDAEDRKKAERVERAKIRLLDMMLDDENLSDELRVELLALRAYKTFDLLLTKLSETVILDNPVEEKTELKLKVAEYFTQVETGIRQFIEISNIKINEGE